MTKPFSIRTYDIFEGEYEKLTLNIFTLESFIDWKKAQMLAQKHKPEILKELKNLEKIAKEHFNN